jgi:hypothetical protein
MSSVLLRIGAMMHVMDLALSCLLLSSGLMEEANPLAEAIYEHGGLPGLVAFKMFFLTAGVAILEQALERRSALAGWGAAITFAAGAYAVVMLVLVAAISLNLPPTL